MTNFPGLALGLTKFPPEILIEILAALPDLASIQSAIQGSRAFYLVWKTHHSSICKLILHRSNLPCLDDANRLATFQEQHLGFSDSTHNKRVLLISTLACQCVEVCFKSIVKPWYLRRNNPHITETERVRIHHNCYNVWIALHFVVEQIRTNRYPGGENPLSDFFANTPLLTLHCWSDMAEWMADCTCWSPPSTAIQDGMMEPLGLDSESPRLYMKAMWDIRRALSHRIWHDHQYVGRGKSSPSYLFLVFDNYYYEYAESPMMQV